MDVIFPDGTPVRASAIVDRDEHASGRDFGLYLDPRWSPTWPAEVIDWPDFGLPVDGARAASQIRAAFARAKAGEVVEVGCLGGLGRTGTVLACMAVLAGVESSQAVAWVRENYRSGAVETPEQESWVAWFAESGTTRAMDPPPLDLASSEALAVEAARHWGLELGPPFGMSNVSYVAPAADLVVKVAWGGDDESLHEPDALELWNGDGAVRLRGRFGRALLEERAFPGDDLAALPEAEATAIAVDIASRLWRDAQPPFRPVLTEVRRWLGRAAAEGSELVPLARELLAEVGEPGSWVVHGDFHHHNILRHGERYVAIDPKPYVAEREYDIPSFLWNPMSNRLDDRARAEERIAAFVAAGLDDFRIRAWTVIRGAYLRPALASAIKDLL